ncbi:hypothetical protein Hanom_Chr01g00015871 [Helianthus anomalus]
MIFVICLFIGSGRAINEAKQIHSGEKLSDRYICGGLCWKSKEMCTINCKEACEVKGHCAS